MTPRSNRTLIISLFNLLIVLSLAVFVFVKGKNEAIVYVDNAKVFTEFNMSVEMKKIGEQEINYRSKIVDSLYNLIQKTDNDQTKEMLVKEFAVQKEELENFSSGYASQESEKIWQRIKSYVKDFSEENGYELVLGMQPNENILYGSESKDVSKEFIVYINKKYEGDK